MGKDKSSKRAQRVFTLLVNVGRKEGDGLPADCTGAALVVYAAGVDESEAVREAVAVLKVADLAPLDVTSYGDAAERAEVEGEISEEEQELMEIALDQNSVIVAQCEPTN